MIKLRKTIPGIIGIILLALGIYFLFLADSSEETPSRRDVSSDVEEETGSDKSDDEGARSVEAGSVEDQSDEPEFTNRFRVTAREVVSEDLVPGIEVYLFTPEEMKIDDKHSLSSETGEEGRVSWTDLPPGEGYRFGVSLEEELSFQDLKPGVADTTVLNRYRQINSNKRLSGSEGYEVKDTDFLSKSFSIQKEEDVRGKIIVNYGTVISGRVKVLGEPVEGAQVEVKYPEDQGAGEYIHRVGGTATGEDGSFKMIGFDGGEYHLNITHVDENKDIFLISDYVEIEKGERKDLGVLKPEMEQVLQVKIPLQSPDGSQLPPELSDIEIPVKALVDVLPSFEKGDLDWPGVGPNLISTPWIEYTAPTSFRVFGVSSEGRVSGSTTVETEAPLKYETERSDDRIFLPQDEPVLEMPITVERKTKFHIRMANLSRGDEDKEPEIMFTNGDTSYTVVNYSKFSDIGNIYEKEIYLPAIPDKDNRLIFRSDLNDADGMYYEKEIELDQQGEEQHVDFSPGYREGASIKGRIPDHLIPDRSIFRKRIGILLGHGMKGPIFGTFTADKDGKFEAHNLPPETEMTINLNQRTIEFETGINGSIKTIQMEDQ